MTLIDSPEPQVTWKLVEDTSVMEPPPLRLMEAPVWPKVTAWPLIQTAFARSSAMVMRSAPTSAASIVMTLTVEPADHGSSRTCTWNVSPATVDCARTNSPSAWKS